MHRGLLQNSSGLYENSGASQSFLEKDDGEFDVRNINGVDYYILSNVNNRKVTWIVDNLQVVISGSLSDDEINSMIDSINEG